MSEIIPPRICGTLRAIVITVFLPVAASADAAALPVATDAAAQELLRQQERERALRQQKEQSPNVQLEPQTVEVVGRLPKNEVPCFPIRRIKLTGDSAEYFQWALEAADPKDDPASSRCLGAAGINLVMKRVQNAIIRKGYVTTRVLASPQNLKHGTLSMTVIPGRVRNVRFSEDSGRRATKWVAAPVRSGDILNLRDIEQALENFKRIPTAEADIQIAPAEGADARPGESDLIIARKRAFPFRLSLSVDDAGSKATGKYQGSITLSYDDWWTLNDLFYISFNRDLGDGNPGNKGARGYTAHYSVPYGYWLLGLTTSGYHYYQSVAGMNQPYVYSGSSRNNDIRLARLIYRDAVCKTGVYLRGWMRTSNNFIDDTEIEVQRRRMAGWEAGLTHREFIGGSAMLDAVLGYRRGTGAMGAMTAPEEAFGEGASRPELVTAAAQFNVPFTVHSQPLRYAAAWRTQWSRTPLVPQDRFAIGGRYTVRGYDGEMYLTGDRGWLIRNDLGLQLGGTGQELYFGADYGEVSGPSTRHLLGTRLAGAGTGLRGSYQGLSWDLFIGRPISKPSGFRTAGTTADFSLYWSY